MWAAAAGACGRAGVRPGVRLQGILGVPQINASLGAKSGGLENIAPLVAKQAEMLEALGCVCMPHPVRFGEATAAMARARPLGPESERYAPTTRIRASNGPRLHRVEVSLWPPHGCSAALCRSINAYLLHALLA
jgi:hypothetical protein